MRLIDADSLKSKVEAMVIHKFNESDYEYGRNQAFDYVADILIDDAPTIDAVEVVRCRDCIHWFPHTQCGFDEDCDEYHDYCGLLIPDDDYYAYRRKANDYCSYGERREGGEA